MKSILIFLESEKIHTLKNKPKGVSPREWLQIEKDTQFQNEPWYNKGTWGKSKVDNKYYGWSHRAIYGFEKGQKIKKDTLGNPKDTEWTIKTDKEAAMMASLFSSDVS